MSSVKTGVKNSLALQFLSLSDPESSSEFTDGHAARTAFWVVLK